MGLKTDCFTLIKHAIDAINPQKLIIQNLKLVNNDCLLVNNKFEYKLNKNVYIAAFGKAVYGMCKEVENMLGSHIVSGIAILPIGLKNDVALDTIRHTGKIDYMFGANNNIPDNDSYEAARKLYALCESLTDSDLLIALVSGGGSALLSLPVDGVALSDKIAITKLIASAGASINELNKFRMCLSKTKAGGLARAAYPATILSLIISDVLDDPIDIIASGPTCIAHLERANTTARLNEALNIIKKYNLENKIPKNVQDHLQAASLQTNLDQIKFNELSQKTQNIIIGTNVFATNAMKQKATDELDYTVALTLTNSLDGEAKYCGAVYAHLAFALSNLDFYKSNLKFCQNLFHSNLNQDGVQLLNKFLSKCLNHLNQTGCDSGKMCVLSGGETTVNLLDAKKLNGTGGRNQEFTLAFKKTFTELVSVVQQCFIDAEINDDILFTSFGTDGIDGPCDAAGAIAVSPFDNDFEYMEKCLNEHNSYGYFNNTDNHIKIGHTGTNVSDVQLLLINLKKA